MRVRLTPPAALEFTDALQWDTDIREALATCFVDDYERLIERLRDNPHQLSRVRRNARRAGFRRFPYSLIFRIHPDEVEIIACYHDRRDRAIGSDGNNRSFCTAAIRSYGNIAIKRTVTETELNVVQHCPRLRKSG
jgi:toxin ParE1/3/4